MMKLILQLRWITGMAFVLLVLSTFVNTVTEPVSANAIGEKSFFDQGINEKQYYSEIFIS